jgi:hypothetical protein
LHLKEWDDPVGSNFNLAQTHANGILTYASGGANFKAAVRITDASYTYQLQSSESQSRLYRAFYPHRRSLGQFTLTVECIGYKEYKLFQTWMTNYTTTLLNAAWSNAGSTTLINAKMASRNFNKTGILVSGLGDGDHVGAMTYDCDLVFMTLEDANDPTTSILKTTQISDFQKAAIDSGPLGSLDFYPVTASQSSDANFYNTPTGTTPALPPPVVAPPITGGASTNPHAIPAPPPTGTATVGH